MHGRKKHHIDSQGDRNSSSLNFATDKEVKIPFRGDIQWENWKIPSPFFKL